MKLVLERFANRYGFLQNTLRIPKHFSLSFNRSAVVLARPFDAALYLDKVSVVWYTVKMIRENSPTIETERFFLRKFSEFDIDDMCSLYGDKEVNRFLPWFPLATVKAVKEYYTAEILPYYEKETGYNYAIVPKETGRIVGYVCISDIGGSNDVGYAIAKEHWRKGIATEAVAAVIARCKAAGFSFVTATHDIKNPYSGEVMKKVGMTYRYSYYELWQPKNICVTFRLYQLDFKGGNKTYAGYKQRYEAFIEEIV